MDSNYPSVESEFDTLSFTDQKQVIAECMGQHEIPWRVVLKNQYPQFTDKRRLDFLIDQYKRGNGDLVRSPYTDAPEAGKRTYANISPNNGAADAPAPAANDQNNAVSRDLFREIGGVLYRREPDQEIGHRTNPTRQVNGEGNAQRRAGLSHNYNSANSMKSNLETHRLLTPLRPRSWICGDGNEVFHNPRKVVHTVLNWHNVVFDQEDLAALPGIENVYEPDKLIKTLTTFCSTRDITLTKGNKSVEELFNCKDPATNPILIVFAATLHKAEENILNYPVATFVQLMLLYQTEPQFVLTGSALNSNLYMGTSIRNGDYGAQRTFDPYMHVNVNHKLVPVRREDGKPGGLLRKLRFHSSYTTTSLVARST